MIRIIIVKYTCLYYLFFIVRKRQILILMFVFLFDFKDGIVKGCSVIVDWLDANLATEVAAVSGHVLIHFQNCKRIKKFKC